MLLINTFFRIQHFACFPDVEELMTKETILKEELRQIDLAAFAKKVEIAKVQEELLEYKKLKSSLPCFVKSSCVTMSRNISLTVRSF